MYKAPSFSVRSSFGALSSDDSSTTLSSSFVDIVTSRVAEGWEEISGDQRLLAIKHSR